MSFSASPDYKNLLTLIDALCVQHTCTPTDVITQLGMDYQLARSKIESDVIIDIPAFASCFPSRGSDINKSLNAPLPKPFPGADHWLTRTGT